MAASEVGIREVRGIEFAHELYEIAKKNCAQYKTKKGFPTTYRIVEGDVIDYAINPDENVFFLFNPFDETVLTKVLHNITASLQAKPRRVWIIYYYPDHANVIEQQGSFSRLQEFMTWQHRFRVYSNGN